MKTVNIYTDGACSGNQSEKNKGGWGCVLEYNGHRKELSGAEPDTTNNRMELTALIEGLSALKEKGLELRIFSDSSYLVNCFKNRWYENWQRNGWKTASRAPVENRDLWARLIELLEGQHPGFYLVKGHLPKDPDEDRLEKEYKRFLGHNGDFAFEDFKTVCACNRRCDELATKAAASLKDPCEGKYPAAETKGE